MILHAIAEHHAVRFVLLEAERVVAVEAGVADGVPSGSPPANYRRLHMGHERVVVDTGELAAELATGFGPRVVRLAPRGGPNLLAELTDDVGIDLAGGRRYTFRGGHRLWVAPEVPSVTYEPDDEPVESQRSDRGARVSASAGGIRKTIDVRVAGRYLEVEHVVASDGRRRIEAAPWAITQLPPGGIALMPIQRTPADERDLQPDHALVGWPYTDWGALGYDAAASVVLVEGRRATPTKVGTTATRGWLAYARDGWVFAKYLLPGPATSIDRGANLQVYAGPDFVELETLGPVETLAGHRRARLVEMWDVAPAPGTPADVAAQVDARYPWD